ncbi:acyltransferase [Pedobacter sp. PAMC26386]|nr:acyltransferase [Pedobacter sp. PAMC26386]
MHLPALTNHTDTIVTHKLSGLDHLRAFAITIVFFYHYQHFAPQGWQEKISSFGWIGVDLFFVLSGFLIAGQIFKTISQGKKISLREFFIKRFFRIIPAYIVILLLYITFPILREREHLAPIWRYLTFTLNMDLDLRNTGTFTHAWSLCIEEQFYLLLPLIICTVSYFRIGKNAVYIFVFLFALGFVLRIWSWNQFIEPQLSNDSFRFLWYKYLYYPTYNRLDGLLTGVSIAALLNFYPLYYQRINKYANWLLAAGLFILCCVCYLCADQYSFNASIFGFTLVSLAFGAIVAAAACSTCILYQYQSKFTYHLATLSYAIYLSHKIITHITQNLFEKMGLEKDGNLLLVCCIISSLLAALLLRYSIELPFLRLRDRILSAKSQ